jgi:hypothetical protein
VRLTSKQKAGRYLLEGSVQQPPDRTQLATAEVTKRGWVPIKHKDYAPMRRDILYRYLERQPIEQIAQVYCVSEKTIRSVLKMPELLAEKERILAMMTQHMSTKLELLLPEAIDTLKDTMRGTNYSELKMKAAKEVLDHAKSMRPQEGSDPVKDLGAAIIRELGKKISAPEPLDVTEAEVVDESQE